MFRQMMAQQTSLHQEMIGFRKSVADEFQSQGTVIQSLVARVNTLEQQRVGPVAGAAPPGSGLSSARDEPAGGSRPDILFERDPWAQYNQKAAAVGGGAPSFSLAGRPASSRGPIGPLPSALEFTPSKIFARGFAAWQDCPAIERFGFSREKLKGTGRMLKTS